MEEEFAKLQAYIEQLSEEKTRCENRLTNAGKLIMLLGDEGERWQATATTVLAQAWTTQ